MPHGHRGEASLESRVVLLEDRLRRARFAVAGLWTVLVLLALVAWRSDDEVRTARLVLTNEPDTAVLVLRAVAPAGGPGLVLETPSGQQVLVLGGEAVRRARR